MDTVRARECPLLTTLIMRRLTPLTGQMKPIGLPGLSSPPRSRAFMSISKTWSFPSRMNGRAASSYSIYPRPPHSRCIRPFRVPKILSFGPTMTAHAVENSGNIPASHSPTSGRDSGHPATHQRLAPRGSRRRARPPAAPRRAWCSSAGASRFGRHRAAAHAPSRPARRATRGARRARAAAARKSAAAASAPNLASCRCASATASPAAAPARALAVELVVLVDPAHRRVQPRVGQRPVRGRGEAVVVAHRVEQARVRARERLPSAAKPRAAPGAGPATSPSASASSTAPRAPSAATAAASSSAAKSHRRARGREPRVARRGAHAPAPARRSRARRTAARAAGGAAALPARGGRSIRGRGRAAHFAAASARARRPKVLGRYAAARAVAVAVAACR